MATIAYDVYLDKVYGCFLGKTVIGTLGAPYEGIKMPLELPFAPDMINTMLPNDDLDLQVLWLDVAERYGKDFTSARLLERFCTHCDYSPGEYAVMRKNFARGICPPASGSFSNDFYRSGMGCPIRSEVWACLSPLDPEGAVDYAVRDGVLDHVNDSVYAEMFLAALESLCFGIVPTRDDAQVDFCGLIDRALSYIPADCRFYTLVTDTVDWCRTYGEQGIKRILRKILHKYGHPDCTNLYQNMGITLAALLLGGLDPVKIGMDALNCGFDTDCTCATAGAIVGLVLGGRTLESRYGWRDIKFVLGVRSDRRSDCVYDFAEDVALLGKDWNPATVIGGAGKDFAYEPLPAVSVCAVKYPPKPDGCPDCSITLGESRTVTVRFRNSTDRDMVVPYTAEGLGLAAKGTVTVAPGSIEDVRLTVTIPADLEVLPETNLYTVTFASDGVPSTHTFGLVGATLWKAIGPIWRTDPPCTTEALMRVPNYWHLMQAKERYKGDATDIVRRFHLNMAVDTTTPYLTADELYAPLDPTADTRYEETLFSQREDSFRLEDVYGFSGPSVCYLVRELISPADETVCVQMGHSAPFALYINGELICERPTCDTWDAENVHVQNVKLRRGVNTVVLRLSRVNADAKYNLIFSEGATCATHIVHYASVNPACFGRGGNAYST